MDAAMEIVRERGLAALTARELAGRLGSSPRPIFTQFQDMDELKREVMQEANRYLGAYVAKAAANTPAFKQMGMMIIQFAKDEPKLYQLLMMEASQPQTFDQMVERASGKDGAAIKVIQAGYAVSEAQAKVIFRQMWLSTYAVGALCAKGVCELSEEEISVLLSTQFKALFAYVQSEELAAGAVASQPSDSGFESEKAQ